MGGVGGMAVGYGKSKAQEGAMDGHAARRLLVDCVVN